MITTYRLHVNELSSELLDSIRAAFKNKTIEIIVAEADDETGYLLASEANRKHIFESIEQLEKGEGIEMSVHELLAKYGSGQ